jgi:hypothetical protein
VLTGLGSGRPGPSDDVATALERARASLGQRPAITVHQTLPSVGSAVATELRHEQGFSSLTGWVAKGAHLLRDELLLGPGDELGVAGPASWPLAAVALSAWWVGVTLVPPDRATALVQHVAAGTAPAGADVLWFGDAMDGTDSAERGGSGEWWAEAVVPFPDRPPAPSRDGGLIALRASGVTLTQRDLLTRCVDAQGVLGVMRDAEVSGSFDAGLITALALRPLVTGRATVVTVTVPGSISQEGSPLARIASAERITQWWSPTD